MNKVIEKEVDENDAKQVTGDQRNLKVVVEVDLFDNIETEVVMILLLQL